MSFILATKQEMTRVFTDDGRARAATVLRAGPMTVTQVKTAEKDGYGAVQVGTGERRASRVSKAVLGHTGGRGYAAIREFAPDESVAVGDTIDISGFSVGDAVRVVGVSKGKGFAGVVKRHGFHGGRRSHGQKHSEREPGSIGGGPGRAGGKVVKGMRMAGRMGGERVTVTGLTVLAVDPQASTLIISGAVPGRRGTLLEVTSLPTKG